MRRGVSAKLQPRFGLGPQLCMVGYHGFNKLVRVLQVSLLRSQPRFIASGLRHIYVCSFNLELNLGFPFS